MRRILYLLTSFILGAGIIFAFLQQLGLFEVRSIPVEISSHVGMSSATSASVFKGSGLDERLKQAVSPLIGKRIWEIDLKQMKASFAQDEWIKDVLISRSLPNGLRVQVTQKNPILVVVTRQSEFFPVTDKGEILGSLEMSQLPDVPLLRGERFLFDDKYLKRAVDLVMSLPDRGPLSPSNVSEVSWNSEEGFTLTLIHPRVEVKLGDERIDVKSLRVSQVLNYLAVNQLKGRVIDASFSKKVLVRLRKGP